MANIWDKFDKAIDTAGLVEDVKDAAENGGGNFKEVPHGEYEVEVNKLELGESKKGDPMVILWFKILEGDYKGSMIFMYQVVNQGFQIHIVNEILRAMIEKSPMDVVEFKNYNQYGNLLMDIFETIDGNFEFQLDYAKGKKDFSTYTINDVFELEG